MTKAKKRTDGFRGRWQVTGINRLIMEREPITPPCQYEQALYIYNREIIKPAHKRDYIYPKIERAREGFQLELFK